MPPDLLPALLDPTAPVPAGWPTGAWGAFLLFLIPIGGGIPSGVLIGRDAGVSPIVLALLYLVSDVFLAVTHEPVLIFFRYLGRIVPVLGQRMTALMAQSGLRDSGPRGPLGLILLSFTVDPITGRATAAAAGHGFIPGWTFAIVGDMFYFGVLMASTIWLSDVLGDERRTVGAVLLGMWLMPMLIRRWRASRPATAPPAGHAGGRRPQRWRRWRE
jgi:hypothetical protein